MAIRTVDELDLKGKRVFVRVDFNVPLGKEGRITDDTRIRASLDTIRYVRDKGGRVIVASHLGRPKGKRVPEMSVAPAAVRLAELLGSPVKTASDCVGPEVEKTVDALNAGEVLLLENLRFHKEEEANDPEFAKALAKLADVYVNDAFGAAHRAHASTEGMVRHVREVAAGFLMRKEIRYLEEALREPARPFLTILGGAKVSDKIGVVRNLLPKVDALVIGGGMANTFLWTQGLAVGASKVEEDKKEEASKVLGEASSAGRKILLPEDVVIAQKIEASAETRVVPADRIPEGWLALDIGPKSRERFCAEIRKARTIVWNGPLGVFEVEPFAEGTRAVARAVAESGAVTIVGGGDTVAALEKENLKGKITHVSTGGGASLEYLEGRVLPGVAALDR